MNPDQMTASSPLRVGIVGSGRVGTALARGLRDVGVEVEGPAGRGERPERCDAIVLCVPDSEIAAAAEAFPAWRDTSLAKRLQKNINLIDLEGTVAPPMILAESLAARPLSLDAVKGSASLQ